MKFIPTHSIQELQPTSFHFVYFSGEPVLDSLRGPFEAKGLYVMNSFLSRIHACSSTLEEKQQLRREAISRCLAFIHVPLQRNEHLGKWELKVALELQKESYLPFLIYSLPDSPPYEECLQILPGRTLDAIAFSLARLISD